MLRIFFIAFILFNFLFAQENVNLQLSWKNQFQFAGYYMAKEKGFYTDVNLNVNIKEYENGIDASDDVVKGKADFAVGRSSLIRDRHEGKPIVILAAIFQHSPEMLLTKKRDDISKIEDLKDKKIMLSGDLTASAPINAMLQSKKVTKDMFIVQEHSFNVQDLIDGKTDAILSYVSNEPYALQKQNIPYTIFSPRDYNFDFYSDILFTSKSLLEKNPKLIESFREASLRGWKYALEHKNEATSLILKKYNTQNKTEDALLFEANEIEKLINQNTIELGNIDPKKIEYITQIYSLMGFINTKEKVTDFIYKIEKPVNSNVAKLTIEEKEFIKTHPKIILGADQNWKPFDWKDESGNHAGFDADFTRLLEEKLNINIEVKLGDWDDIQNDVKDKKIDGIIGASKNNKRDEYLLFTKPYFMFTQVVLVGKENKSISSLSDLDGKTIALKKGSLDITYFNEKYPNIKQKLYNNDSEIIVALSEKEIDAALSNIGAASYEIERNFISNLKVAFNIDELAGDMRYGIRNDQPLLTSILQKGIDLITKDEINIILARWIKLAVTNDNSPKLNLTKEETAWLDKKIPLKYVYDPDGAPFEWKNELGEHAGIVSDLLNLIKEKSGIKFQQIPTETWSDSVSLMQENKADMFSAIGENEDKKTYLNFTKNTIFKTPYVLVSRIDDKNDYLETFQAIENKKVAVVDGYTIHGILKDKKPNTSILTVKNLNEGFEKVRDKTLDIFIVNAASARYFINTKGYEDLKIATKIEFNLELKIALQKELPNEVISILDKAIDSIGEKESEDIYYKWTEVKVINKIDWDLMKKVFALFILFLVGTIYWGRKLSVAKKIAEKATFEADKAKEEIELILSNILLPVLITSKKNRKILYANKYAQKQYEMPIDILIGSNIDDLYTIAGQQEHIIEAIKRDGFVENIEEVFKTSKGKKFTALLSVSPITYQNEESYIGMITDITKQKEMENEVRTIHKHTRESIEYAALIQSAIIPDNKIFEHFFQEYFTIWNPKDVVGGDIYLMNELNENEVILMVIDCTGHGVPGAFVTMLVKAIERQIMADINKDKTVSPAKILSIFNQSIKNLLKQESIDSVSNAGFDGGIIYYNKKEKIVKFSGAETAFFYIDEINNLQSIKGSRHSVGYKKSDINFEFKEHIIEVQDGMQFYITTDGYLDQNGGKKGFPFGKRQFNRIIEENKYNTMEEQKSILLAELNSYQQDEERNDDITVVGFKI